MPESYAPYGPSRAAKMAALTGTPPDPDDVIEAAILDGLDRAHAPALGLDRSVSGTFVREWLIDQSDAYRVGTPEAALMTKLLIAWQSQ